MKNVIIVLLCISIIYYVFIYRKPYTMENITTYYYNKITDYGVIGDGVADNTEKFQLAVNQLQGKTIEIPSGVYLISSGITIPSNTTIIGAGKNNTIIKLKNNIQGDIDSMIKTLSSVSNRAENIYIKNITFDGNRKNNIKYPIGSGTNSNPTGTGESTPLCLLNINYTDNVNIENCKITNAMNSGIWLIDCTNMVVENCIFNYYRIQGVAVRSYNSPTGSQNYKIINNYFGFPDSYDPLDTAGGIVGIELIFGTTGGIIYGNHIANNMQENCYPYWGWNGNYPYKYPLGNQPPNIEVPNQGDGAGIELSGYYSTNDPGSVLPENHTIISNNYSTNNQVGIRAEQNSQNITISNNTVTKNKMYGIFIYSGIKIICNSNIITGNNISGISIQNAPGQNLPSDIQLVSNRIEGLTNNTGIELRACNGCIITNNIIQQQQIGIGLYDSEYNFCNNVIIDSNIYNNVKEQFYADPLSSSGNFINSVNFSY